MLNIRRASINDIDEILHLNNQLCIYEMESGFDTYIKDWSLSNMSRNYFLDLIKNNFVIVAEDNKVLVGYLAGGITEDGSYSYYKGKTAELQNMFIKAEYRKSGLGSQFITEFENWCKQQEAARMMVTASIDNELARLFYEKNGFLNINITLKKDLNVNVKQEQEDFKKVTIYTDGACSGNPGVGGWGAVLFYKGNKKEISGVEENTTNNRMELTAAIKALDTLKEGNYEIDLYSDSAYLINAFKEDWITKWQLNGFKNANKKEVANIDLWQQIISYNNKYSINWIKVKGHADNEYNNRCDALATGEIARFKNQ